jgi:Protein of unknown function (DUF3800)
MAIFNAYLDESRNQYPNGGVRVLTIAGYVAFAQDFVGLSEAWRKLLDLYLAPIGLRRFHMVDFECHRKGFEKLNRHDACALFSGLVGIINSLEIQPIGASVNLAEWDALGDAVSPKDDPYNLMMQAITHIIAEGIWSNDGKEEIAFTFDCQQKAFERHAHRAFEYLQENDPYGKRLLHLGFSSSYKVMELQAADILAYDICKSFRNRLAGDTRPPRYSTKLLGLKREIIHKEVHLGAKPNDQAATGVIRR